jgi:quinol monooxygenase YgiN
MAALAALTRLLIMSDLARSRADSRELSRAASRLLPFETARNRRDGLAQCTSAIRCGNESKRTSSNLSGPIVMPKFANVVTIEVAPGRRDQVVTELAAHKARLKDEPGTLQFEVLLPQDDDTKIFAFEMYRDAAAFEVHLNGPSLAQLREEIAGMVMKLHGVRCAVLD